MFIFHRKYPVIGDLPAGQVVTPQWWAREALARMQEKTVLLGVVNRDYEDRLSRYGEVVNIHHEQGFTAMRKYQDEQIVRQQPRAIADSVILNQHLHVAIEVDDRDNALAPMDLIEKYAPRGAEAMVNAMEQVITGEVYNFLAQSAGQIGLTAANADTELLNLREFFQRQNVYNAGRVVALGPATDKIILDTDRFVSASDIIDRVAVDAIRNGFMGRARGFDFYESSFTPEVATGQTVVTGAVNNGAGYLKGTTTLVVDGITGQLVNGCWCYIEGDDLPRRITAATGTPNTTGITISPALSKAVDNNAVITIMETGTIDHPDAEDYPALWDREIQITGFTDFPLVGQGVTFGNSAVGYMVTAVDEGAATILLNRPLDETVAHGATVALIPYGNYNLAAVPEAITFVCRPIAPPMSGTGVASGWASANNLALRVTYGYDMNYMKTTLTFDALCAVKTLDRRYGAVLVS